MRRWIFWSLFLLTPSLRAEIISFPYLKLMPPKLIDNISTVNDGQTTTMYMTLDHVPDFTTRDQFGRPHESFQWYLTTDLNSNPMRDPQYLVRGDELGGLNGSVAFCGVATPTGQQTGCQGWGTVLGQFAVDWDPESLTLSWSLGNNLLPATDVLYNVLALNYGAGNDEYEGILGDDDAVQFGPTQLAFAPNNGTGLPPDAFIPPPTPVPHHATAPVLTAPSFSAPNFSAPDPDNSDPPDPPDTTSVPESSSFVLLAIGVGAVLSRRKV